MKLLIVGGSPRKNSHSHALAEVALEYAKSKKIDVSLLDLHENGMESFQGFGVEYNKKTQKVIDALKECDCFILSTPAYNSSYSGAIKNLFEHSNYKRLKNKVVGFIINGGTEKSFENVQSQLNSLMNYFGILSNQKAVFVLASEAFNKEVKLTDESIKDRIEELVDSTLGLAESYSQK